MARGSFAIPLTALIAGVIGLGVGLYLGPTEEAKEFRDLMQRYAPGDHRLLERRFP